MTSMEIVVGQERASVADLIGKGGEGKVYGLKGHPGLAVKIYNSNLCAKREDKVRAMVKVSLATKTDLIAYPRDVVTDGRGRFLGFTMRLVSGYRPLHELYSPKSRLRHYPKADYRFIVHAALNVARAVAKVHQTECVIGDLNHSGVLVAQDATVALIDADSFQFRLDGKSYPCVVGVPEFTPPELHGKNLTCVERTSEHDNFGLAVAIFQLLFMGRHPYAGRHTGSDLSMGQAIAQNRFAFSLSRRAETQTTPPPGSLTLDMFPDAISRAFENAFGLLPGSRPEALEWIRALETLRDSLTRCRKVTSHYYPKNAGACVWCNLTVVNGLDMFPDLAVVERNITTDQRGTEDAIREILAFGFPTVMDLLPVVPTGSGLSKALRAARRGKVGRAALGLFMIGAGGVGLIYAMPLWFLWVGLAFWGLGLIVDYKVEPDQFERAFKDADERVQRELNTLIQRHGMSEVMLVRSQLDVVISAYKSHDGLLARELSLFKSNRESRQRQSYLDGFPIRRANISGVGPAKTATLISYGIETAADVSESAVSAVPGFGYVMTSKLMAWRRSHESRFKYDPTPNAQDVADERELRGRFAAEKSDFESTIRKGLNTLRNAKARLNTLAVNARSDKALIDAVAAREQAGSDLRSLGVPVPASNVALTPARPVPQTLHVPRGLTQTQPRQPAAPGTPRCPRCGSIMQRRSGRYGPFWGCSQYPRCTYTRNS